jgi:hypothetical protein
MKIGIDAREFLSGRMTGIGRYLRQFLQCATELPSPHEYVLFCNQKTHVPVEHPKLKKIIIQERITLFWDQIQLPLCMAREKVDIFLTPYFKSSYFLSANLVLIINDLIPLLFPEELGFFKRHYFRSMWRIAARRAKRVMTISQNSKDDIVKVLKVSPDKIKVVHLAVEERFMSLDVRVEEIRRKYSLPEEFIFYVGNLSPHKNIQGLVKAYKTLPEMLRQKYKLVIAASKKTKYLADIEKVIREMELSAEVFFTGFIEEKDLPAVYRMSELFVFPSLYEGFGLPPLEAMASGCPVVSSNTSSLPEVLGNAALLFNPYDVEEMSSAMGKMLEDEDLRNKFRQKGRERAKIFAPEKMTEEIVFLLESI